MPIVQSACKFAAEMLYFFHEGTERAARCSARGREITSGRSIEHMYRGPQHDLAAHGENGVRACVDEFYAPESMTSDGGCAYYDVVLADISDRQTREQYLRFFRDLRLTSPQTKLILLSADPLAALDVFECDPDYFVCKLEMETRLSAALRFVLRPCGGELGPCLIVGSRATRHVLSMREILYCEHAQRQTKIVMTTRTVTCSEKLNEIYGRLDPAEFVQTHCSFLVNLSYVKELRRTCVVLRSGACVPLSRANYARVRQALAQHLSHALGGERPLFTLSER